MSPKQDFLGQNARTFIQQANLTSNDYQVAVIATEWSGTAGTGFPHKANSASAYPGADIWPGEFFGNPKVIRRTDPDPAAELAKNIRVGDVGSDSAESGLEGAKAALTTRSSATPASPTAPSSREDAKRRIIVLSDEDDLRPSKNVQYYIDLFTRHLKARTTRRMFSFTPSPGHGPPAAAAPRSAASPLSASEGKRYKEATRWATASSGPSAPATGAPRHEDRPWTPSPRRLQYSLSRACDVAT
jgi:hypothetical protein